MTAGIHVFKNGFFFTVHRVIDGGLVASIRVPDQEPKKKQERSKNNEHIVVVVGTKVGQLWSPFA